MHQDDALMIFRGIGFAIVIEAACVLFGLTVWYSYWVAL